MNITGVLTPELFSLISLGLTLVSVVFTVLIYVRVNKFFKEGSGKSFEDTAGSILNNVSDLQNFRAELIKYVEVLEKRLSRALQVAIAKRYNPFKGTGEGGQQSHTTVLLDEHGDGVVLSTLATRDRQSHFAKPIQKFASSEVELTPEEKEILNDARKVIAP